MKLKQMRLARGIQQKELASLIGTDEPTISKFENHKCLPTPDMMERLLQALNCSIFDVYERSEITYRKPKKVPTAPQEWYRVSGRVPIALKNDLQVALKGCGYSSIGEWLLQCAERLQAEYAIRQKQEETPSTADQSTDEVKLNTRKDVLQPNCITKAPSCQEGR